MPRDCCPYREAQFQGRLWTPQNLGVAPIAWYEFNQNDVDSSGLVSRLIDKGGRGNHTATQADTTKRCTIAANGTGLVFDGVNDHYRTATAIARSTDCTSLVVCKSGSDTTKLDSVLRLQPESGNYFVMPYHYNGNRFCINSYAPGFNYDQNSTLFTPSANTNYMFSATFANANQKARLNGAPYFSGTGAMGTGGLDIIDIGSWRASGYYFQGTFFHAIHYHVALAPRELVLLEGYFAWDMQAHGVLNIVRNLPANHPFRARPPLIGD